MLNDRWSRRWGYTRSRTKSDKVLTHGADLKLMSVVRKAEVIIVAKKTSQQPNTENGTVDISREGSLVHQVSNFTYLGVIISSDGYKSMDREL